MTMWSRLRHAVRPGVTVTPPPADVVFERDVEIPMRDGVVLRANVFRPPDDGRYPVVMSAHPYGKDATLPRRRFGRYSVPLQFRMMTQSRPFSISAWTSWEAPDPAFWVPRGYVVVNADLRGWGRSDGTGELLSPQEGDDYHELVEWAAAQPWSNGRVGCNGVSYLAIAQWAVAATRPPHLAAICPWEGFTDLYRDFARPGGVREDGFLRLWSALLQRQHRSPVTVREESAKRPTFDEWWAARNRDLERIDVPALVCASFSDHNLHSRGTFEGFLRIGSRDKWLYTHRGPKWSTYYAPEALEHQARFFDHFLKGDDNGFDREPRVRVEVREDAHTITAVRGEPEWPPPGTQWQPRHLDAADGLLHAQPRAGESSVAFSSQRGHARFEWTLAHDTELVGPMWVRLHVEVRDADDVFLFVGVRKLRHGRVVHFEGSYGFDRALVTQGMCKASMRAADPERSRPWAPFHPCTTPQPLAPGEIVPVDIELAPQATLFRAGETLRLDVQGRWFFPRNPLTGQFPAAYEPSPAGTCVLHTGGAHDAALHVPVRHPVDA